MEGEDHHIYLCNIGNRDIYPENVPGQFENRLNPPLQLDPSKEYEVAMINCLYPKHYHGITKGDYKSRIELWGTLKTPSGGWEQHHITTYIPTSDMDVNNLHQLLETLNLGMLAKFEKALGARLKHYLSKGLDMFHYDEKLDRVRLTVYAGDCVSDDAFCELTLRLGSKIAEILGMMDSIEHKLFQTKMVKHYTIAPYPPRRDGGVDFALFYTDCVSPTRFGGESVNLLEAMSMTGTGGSDLHRVNYKPLSKTYLDAIAIKVTDQVGRPIGFDSRSSMAVVLHIRSK